MPRPSNENMCTLRGTIGNPIQVTLFPIWRTLWKPKDSSESAHSGFFWPNLFKDSHQHVQNYDRCQRVGNISIRNEMTLNNIQEVEIFYVWGIDFMAPFPPSFGKLYILFVVDCVKMGGGNCYKEK